MIHALRNIRCPDAPFDVAVVIPTVMRPSLERAVRSVFKQDCGGRVQILIGIDVPADRSAIADRIDGACPAHMSVTWVDPGYSTSQAHGGVHPNAFGGSLRTVLSHLAEADRLAYLDDDNWWAPHHLSDLLGAIDGHGWAFSLRWFVDPSTGETLTVDDFESVGPDRGVYARRDIGFVDTSSLMLDRRACQDVLHEWAIPMFPNGTGEDRRVLHALRRVGTPGETGRPSVYYTLNPDAGTHPHRDAAFAARGLSPHRPSQARHSSRIGVARHVEDYLAGTDTPRLRIGRGLLPRDGWLSGDFAPVSPAAIPLASTGHLPFADAAFAEIALTAIDSLRFPNARRMLTEAARTLRPGGSLRLQCTDLYRLLDLFLPGRPTPEATGYLDWARKTFVPDVAGATPTVILNELYRTQGLRFLFGEVLLRRLLAQAGFVEIVRPMSDALPDSHPHTALTLDAQRP